VLKLLKIVILLAQKISQKLQVKANNH